jgi:hypothetical protein
MFHMCSALIEIDINAFLYHNLWLILFYQRRKYD